MKPKTKAKPVRAGCGWAWSIDWKGDGRREVCNWAEAVRAGLEAGGKPSPEARPVHVAIVPMAQWRELSTKKGRAKR